MSLSRVTAASQGAILLERTVDFDEVRTGKELDDHAGGHERLASDHSLAASKAALRVYRIGRAALDRARTLRALAEAGCTRIMLGCVTISH